MPKFRAVVGTLESAGKIRQGKKGRLQLKAAAGFVTGIVKKINSGAAFVIPNEPSTATKKMDVYVSSRDLRDAQTGDEVMVRLISRRRSGGQRCGQIEKVLERASNVFVGTYLEAQGQAFVRVDGTALQGDIHVGDPGAKGAQPDDKVVIEMLRFPTANRIGEAVLTEVLGQRGDPGVDTMAVVYSLGLPFEFSEEVLEDARLQAEHFDETDFGDRTDLTKETIVTIDPATARDFDDAISLRKDKRGHWQLGVHIADVAHFVPPGGPLDRSAKDRGTSTYLPRHVIPMLPEVISNGLASLQEGNVRYTKTVFIEFDAQGNPQGAEVANTVIKVSKRFAYEQVMPIIRAPQSQTGKVSAKVTKLLLKMYELAMILRKKRFADGALQMGVPEVEIDFDDDGNVTGAHERHHDESHEIIEEFMLAANIAVAQILTARDIPYLRRVHGTPDELRLKNFQEFCRGLGYELEKFQSKKEIQKLINSVAGEPAERAINFALLRAMKQAEYSPEEFGHYALSEEDYCHFTSPIRRYPDLTIQENALIRKWINVGAPLDAGVVATADLFQVMPESPQPLPPETYRVAIPVTATAFTQDGTILASSGYHEILLWKTDDGSLIRRITNVAERVYDLEFNHDGSQLAVAAGTPGQLGEVKLFSVADGKHQKTLVRTKDAVFAVSYSPDGKSVAAAGADRSVYAVDIATGKTTLKIEDHADWVMDVNWSPDGKQLVTASRDKTAKVFEVASGRSVTTFNGHGNAVYSVAFLSDGKSVVSAGSDKQFGGMLLNVTVTFFFDRGRRCMQPAIEFRCPATPVTCG